jgi:hypothetical protein
MAPSPKSTNPYSLKDWIADWDWFLRERARVIQAGFPTDDPKTWKNLIQYFDDKHGSEADFCRERLLAAPKYAALHSKELDERPFAVAGKDGMLVSAILVQTLWLVYTQLGDDEIAAGPAIEDVRVIGLEIERRVSGG